jgi:hypothetical protein
LSVAVLILAILTLLTSDPNPVLKVFLFAIIAVLPVALDALTYYLNTDLRKVHPELQVITMDAASFACYSNDSGSQAEGMEILSKINNKEVNRAQVCANYRPNTWQSIAYWELSEKDANGLGIENLTDKTQINKIAIQTNMQKSNYNSVRNQWIQTLLSEPKAYFQIKLSQFVQVMVAGDSVGFRIVSLTNDLNPISLVKAIFLSPYDLIISLHLIAPIVVLFFPLIWCAATTIAFIGDNGRYVYAACLLFLLLLPGFISNISDREIKTSDK